AAPTPAALALVMSRGRFETEFAAQAFATVMALAQEHGPGVWDAQAPVIAPGDTAGHAFSDPVAGITASLAFNPEAAQLVLDPN
ncbi:hypothetical protein N3930_46345, partial [Bacillus thuringiensis]|nr:hypothetical protein [Bacillus thuringiensis]